MVCTRSRICMRTRTRNRVGAIYGLLMADIFAFPPDAATARLYQYQYPISMSNIKIDIIHVNQNRYVQTKLSANRSVSYRWITQQETSRSRKEEEGRWEGILTLSIAFQFQPSAFYIIYPIRDYR